MEASKIYEEEQKLNKFETLINEKEILTKEERDFCFDWDLEESKRVLNYVGDGKWLNINVYSEHEHQDYINSLEKGI